MNGQQPLKGVILVPILLAVLVTLLTGSGTAGGVAFLIGLAISAFLVLAQLREATRRRPR
jgi:hypothetical protein